MDSLNLSVVGGRGSSIRVGGLLTGGAGPLPWMISACVLTFRSGGISYFSARKGFVCDNVVNYEIVLGDGRIIQAYAARHSDLWLALKEGSNNSGIVTRFDLRAFEEGHFWGGTIPYPGSATPQLLRFFAILNNPVAFDEYAALIFSFSYTTAFGSSPPPTSNLSIHFQPARFPRLHFDQASVLVNHAHFELDRFHRGICRKPTQWTQVRGIIIITFVILASSTHHADLSLESIPRQPYLTSTFENDLAFLISLYTQFQSTSFSPFAEIFNLAISMPIQPIPPAITSKSGPLGGNSLGLQSSPGRGSLVLCLLSATWDDAADDAAIMNVVRKLHETLVAEGKKRALWNDWIYLNYANQTQDPIAGYGPEIRKRLRETSAKYDKKQVFQKLVPGGFKLIWARGLIRPFWVCFSDHLFKRLLLLYAMEATY